MNEPDKQAVDKAIMQLTARALDGKPVGSVAMLDEVIGFKKMPLWWVSRVHGLRAALTQVYRDWRERRKS